jgi:hypothetical protein
LRVFLSFCRLAAANRSGWPAQRAASSARFKISQNRNEISDMSPI